MKIERSAAYTKFCGKLKCYLESVFVHDDTPDRPHETVKYRGDGTNQGQEIIVIDKRLSVRLEVKRV